MFYPQPILAQSGTPEQWNKGGTMISLLAHEGINQKAFKENFLNRNSAHRTAENVIIRPYRPEDRSAIRRICCDTGFLGKPIETIFSDREIFADLFAAPYLDYGADWAWVAEAGGRVVGYLLGSVSPNFNYTLLYSGFQTTMKMITRAATGRYARHPRTRQFIRWLLVNGYREQPRHPDNAAHLHLNIEKTYRGRDLGIRLWHAYEEQLDRAGIGNCYGAFFSWPQRRPESVYSRLGFSVFDRKLTTIFSPEITDPVEVVCVHKNLAA
jgi:GNAT superfamily N-acetyltransferase